MTEPRSVESRIRSAVIFRNNTRRKVNLIWLDYNGQHVSYNILKESDAPFPLHTFVTHPWIAIDEENQQRLWLNRNDVFYPPEPRFVRIPIGDRIRVQMVPTKVLVTIPVYNPASLQDSCCQFIANMVKLTDIDELDIPPLLKKQVEKLY